jgi:HlyD family secretion protein
MDRELTTAERRRTLTGRAVRIALPLAAVVVLLTLLPGWLRPSLERARLRTAVVERGAVESGFAAAGRVVPAYETVLSSPVEARVVRLLRRAGDRVAAGEPILELDVESLRLERERADERLRRKIAEGETTRAELGRELAELEGQREAAELDRELSAARLDQTRRLSREGLAAADALREAEVTERKARLEVERLQRAAAAARAEAAAKLRGVELEAAVLRQEHAAAERQLELATARATRAGVVTWVVPQEGVVVPRGAPLARVADLTAYGVEADVSDVHAASLAPGQPARVLVGAADLAGTIEAVHPTIEEGVVRFRVALAEASHAALRNNLRVDVHVVTRRLPGVLRLPRGPALQGGRQELFVVAGDRAIRRAVELGLSGPDAWEVVSGLSAGDEVILSDTTDYQRAEEVRLR